MSAGLELAEQKDTRRQLAAVVFMDMVGYSALMQRDEAAAQGAVEQLWALARPCIASQNGEEIRRFGDGLLLVFPGAVAAANCCLEVLTALAAHNDNTDGELRLGLRAGLHLGDIGRHADEIYGDGVNIAARLVNLAPPGAIALSPHVRDQLANTLDAPLKSLGQRRLKNISEPMEVFCLPGPDCSSEALDAAAATGEAAQWRWRFGLASFDQGKQELWVNGQAAQLDPRAAAVLQGLLKHAGEIVSRAELCEAAGDISDGALTGAIERLRKALRDSDQVQIKTHPGQGYRLTPEVSVEATPGARLSQFDFRAGDRPPLRPLWSLQRKLGQGGQGETWLARHDKTGEERVYKFALDTVGQDSLKREITLSRVLHSIDDHGHFIRVLDWNLERPPYFIESQYGGGADLATWAEQQGGPGALPIASRLDLIIQIAEALAAAHSLGVLHKDLKPANVLVDQPAGQPPRIRLADFGSGGVLDPERLDAADITLQGFTSTLPLEGESTAATPAYLAPELLAGQPATIKADIYALGVMLYQILIGDFRRVLSTGWEQDIDDELLREDIAASTQGQPAQRLGDATELARRLSALQERRAVRAQERMAQEQLRRAEVEARRQRQQAERMRLMRRWSTVLMSTLMLGLGISLYLQQRAVRAEASAQEAAQQAQAVADFLSKDLFAAVGDTPLRDLSVAQLLAIAAERLGQRDNQHPIVSAQLHSALGNALLATEQISAANAEFAAALTAYDQAGERLSPAAILVAAQTLMTHLHERSAAELRTLLPAFESLLTEARETLGPQHTAVLRLQFYIADAQQNLGFWRDSAQALQTILEGSPHLSHEEQDIFDFGNLELRLAQALIKLGEFSEAQALLEQILSVSTSTSDATPFQRAGAQVILAGLQTNLRQFASAQALLAQAGDTVSRWSSGPESLSMLQIRIRQAQIAALQEPDAGTLSTYKQLLQEAESNSVARSTPSLGKFWTDYGLVCLSHGAFDSAAVAFRRALELQIPGLGQDYPDVLHSRIGLATALVLLGEPVAARTELQQVNPELLKRIGPDHPYEAAWHRAYGLLEAKQAPAESARRLQTAASIFERRFGAQHPYTVQALEEMESLNRPGFRP